jgi:NAD(P)-dependent dehydrogenase (short-subunit alcohol dehydrogenase family)
MGAARSFQDRVVAVTGAGSGIGRALCLRFGRAGARIALLDRDADAADAVARELQASGGEALAQPCDVTDPQQCSTALEALEKRFGGVDVLIANAGISHRSPCLDTELSVYRQVMDVNFFGALHCVKAALPSLLERRGLIVVTSSIAGFAPLLGRSGYCASKHALHGLFETLRCELAQRGVRVMLVCPGFTATNIERSALDGQGRLARHAQSRVGAVATPEAVAEAVYRGARSGRRLLLLSAAGRASYALSRLAPGLYERAMTRLFRVELEH